MPLYELLEELFSIFKMSHIEEQDAYLFAFFDAVTDYLQSNSSDSTVLSATGMRRCAAKPFPAVKWKVSESSPSTNPKDWNFIQYPSLLRLETGE